MSAVLVDTSVWVAHFRQHNPALAALLGADCALTHPWVRAELACGTPPERARTLSDLAWLPQVRAASLDETLDFIEREHLFGLGCGLVDLTLLASTLLTPGARLWTLDKRLQSLAQRWQRDYLPAVH